MPRENRKRGKKHKKHILEEQPTTEPPWKVQHQNASSEVDEQAPFGHVDASLKAYFRTVDLQMQAWQDAPSSRDDDGELDPNERRLLLPLQPDVVYQLALETRLFFVAALTEMTDKEKQLATDPECSYVLERMIHSMDDFVLRVFVDRMAGS